MFLFFASQGGDRFGPFQQFHVAVFIAEPHQPHEQFEIFVAAFALFQHPRRFEDAAAREPRDFGRIVRRQPFAGGEPRRHPFVRDGRYVDDLHPRQDGGQQPFGRFGDHQEEGLFPRFLDDFQQFVRRLRVHPLGQPDNDRLVFRFERFERQFADDLVGFERADISLFVVYFDGRIPHRFAEIPAGFFEQPPPLRQESVAQRLLARRFSFRRVDRKDEMDIRMGQLRDLAAGRALPARVPVAAVGAV